TPLQPSVERILARTNRTFASSIRLAIPPLRATRKARTEPFDPLEIGLLGELRLTPLERPPRTAFLFEDFDCGAWPLPATRSKARTSWSFRIVCQPLTPRRRARVARSFRVRVRSVCMVIDDFLRLTGRCALAHPPSKRLNERIVPDLLVNLRKSL